MALDHHSLPDILVVLEVLFPAGLHKGRVAEPVLGSEPGSYTACLGVHLQPQAIGRLQPFPDGSFVGGSHGGYQRALSARPQPKPSSHPDSTATQ